LAAVPLVSLPNLSLAWASTYSGNYRMSRNWPGNGRIAAFRAEQLRCKREAGSDWEQPEELEQRRLPGRGQSL